MPQCLQAVRRCGLLLQICYGLCVTQMSCTKMAEPIEVLFGGAHIGPRNLILDGSPGHHMGTVPVHSNVSMCTCFPLKGVMNV